jgi:TolB protein
VPAASTSVPTTWATYTSQTYSVSLRYPPGWQRDPRYTLPGDERYTGPDGFFQLSALSGASLDDAANAEAHHLLQPYGSHPIITTTTVAGGRPARLILPSADQPAELEHQAALIVQPPQPMVVNGASYPYLVVWADQSHLDAIASTLHFVT